MSYSAQVTRGFLKRMSLAQSLTLFICALVFFITDGLGQGMAAAFGGAIALANTLVLRWNFERAEQIAGNSAGENMRLLYRTAAQRLLLTIGLFTLALGGLKLEPLPVLVGFLAGLAAVLIARFGFRK
ncbi:MAG: ATP synthase subunit I [Gammaproteobacteria bacterium]|nr:ATP synthase subunit I [Gammaproteobacteria bacterium]